MWRVCNCITLVHWALLFELQLCVIMHQKIERKHCKVKQTRKIEILRIMPSFILCMSGALTIL